MTPQVSRFAPLLSAVFNDIGSTGVAIPWRITDRSQLDKPGLIKFMMELLETASSIVNSGSKPISLKLSTLSWCTASLAPFAIKFLILVIFFIVS